MSLRSEVIEALENSVENGDTESYTRDSVEIAMEMLEYTTFTDVKLGGPVEEFQASVKLIAMYVKDWQTETADQ